MKHFAGSYSISPSLKYKPSHPKDKGYEICFFIQAGEIVSWFSFPIAISDNVGKSMRSHFVD